MCNAKEEQMRDRQIQTNSESMRVSDGSLSKTHTRCPRAVERFHAPINTESIERDGWGRRADRGKWDKNEQI